MDLDELAWGYALQLARAGEPDDLIKALRDWRTPPSTEVREFLVSLLRRRRLRRGLPGRLRREDIRRIRMAADPTLREALDGYPERNYTSRQWRSFVVKSLAKRYNITPATVRDVIARRGRYAAK